MPFFVLFTFAITGVSPVGAQSFPDCQYSNSDSDGDGYGWENQQTCVVSDVSTQPLAGCIDDDGDGWGWNGMQVCRVENNNCTDTLPVGDGWGWNGTESCALAPYAAPFSELDVLQANVRPGVTSKYGESASAAVLVCYDTDRTIENAQVINFFSDGLATLINSGADHMNNVWSTGLNVHDGIVYVHVTEDNGRGAFQYDIRVNMQPGQLSVESLKNSDDCFWDEG